MFIVKVNIYTHVNLVLIVDVRVHSRKFLGWAAGIGTVGCSGWRPGSVSEGTGFGDWFAVEWCTMGQEIIVGVNIICFNNLNLHFTCRVEWPT